jgi:GH18 family chitinase
MPENADRQYYEKLATCSIWSNNEFFSYDCPEAMRAKLKYARQHHLGGVMFWEMGQDTMDAELLRALHPVAAQKGTAKISRAAH